MNELSLFTGAGGGVGEFQLREAVMEIGKDGGQLNPTWVEWLMGWPRGFTDLRPLAMDKFHSAWLEPFKCYLGELDE